MSARWHEGPLTEWEKIPTVSVPRRPWSILIRRHDQRQVRLVLKVGSRRFAHEPRRHHRPRRFRLPSPRRSRRLSPVSLVAPVSY